MGVSEPFGARDRAVWAASEPRRMQRKEVTHMHAAITRTPVVFIVLAAAALVLVALGLAAGDPALMPPPLCPPNC